MAIINEDQVLIISDQHVDGRKIFEQPPQVLGDILEPKDVVTKEYLETVLDLTLKLALQDPINAIVDELPSSPSEGDRYILSSTNEICTYTSGSWVQELPKNNTLLINSSNWSFLYYNGASWLGVGFLIATKERPGAVQVGSGLDVTEEGILSVSTDNETISISEDKLSVKIDPDGGITITDNGLATTSSAGGSLRLISAVITHENIVNQYVDLSNALPIDCQLIAMLDGSPLMKYGSDYMVIGDDTGSRKRVTWAGMGLAYYIESDEILRIWY